jgi:uncharacterized protein YeaO (DUF488 family)
VGRDRACLTRIDLVPDNALLWIVTHPITPTQTWWEYKLDREDLPMPVRIIRLGSARHRGEGLRIGTVQRPPRGIRKSQYAKQDWFDVWLPNLAPSASLMRKTWIRDDGTGWSAFAKRFWAELKKPEQAHLLDVLAALSRHANFSVGCYCADERLCHRSILGRALRERGAVVK